MAPDPPRDDAPTETPPPLAAPVCLDGDLSAALPVLARPPAEPMLIPYARPVLAQALFMLEVPRIGWWRVLLDLVLVAIAYVSGSVAIIPLEALWQPADERWLSIPATLLSGATVIAICITLLRLEGQRLRAIGATTRSLLANIGIGLGAYATILVGMFMLSIFSIIVFPQLLKNQEQTVHAIRSTFPDMSLLAAASFMCFVAVWEELAFRGFLLTRLQAVLKRWWLTVPVGSLLFGVGHLWQSPTAAVLTTFLGLALSLLFVWRRSLVPCIVLHAINNTVSMLIMRSFE